MDKKQITVDTYDRAAEPLGKLFNEIGPRINDVKRAFSFVNKTSPKVVELGCGNGRDATEILKHTDDYAGYDVSTEMVRLAKEHLPHTRFETADMETLELPDNIDIVFAFASFLHLDIDSVRSVLLKIHGKLAESGIVYASVKLDTYHERIKTDEFGDRVFYYYELKDWQKLADETNFQIIYSDTQELKGTQWLTVAMRRV